MNPSKRTLLWIILLGGACVPLSYVWGILAHPAGSARLWGGMPPGLLPVYQINMLLGAAGFFLFTYYLLFRLDPDQARPFGRVDFRLFSVLYAAILIPSALWMPLSLAVIERPGILLWLLVRLDLAVTGLASLGLLTALIGLPPPARRPSYWLALAGCVFFCLQTAVLDALLWPYYF